MKIPVTAALATMLLVPLLGISFAFAIPTVGQTPFHYNENPENTQFSSNASAYNVSECPSPETRPVIRVAVVGAGISGTSAAYLLSKAQKHLDKVNAYGIPGCKNVTWPERVLVTVYERSERIGGRIQSIHPLDDPKCPPIESGASIFSEVNAHLVQASSSLHLERTPREMIPNGGYGLWNGEEMLIDNFGGSKWDQLRLYWRYGFSPQTTLNL